MSNYIIKTLDYKGKHIMFEDDIQQVYKEKHLYIMVTI
ncbi:hypothetical protein SS7213T_00020 [Staphylococcus simiae CCM 7213 = CCUG 51256]|uniref:Uncharacterized protein n=1 Tax=Staphylococcus simiae CCM 7213 = CCUG 51256 TaxID=911238 RepID=G5JF17_9STAP|nr:hypothetical protein SS7213T_00020 [Staphylococcus simiae CCM 7213 = CCUG 51256]SNV61747.1 Uncharacterised protein [Staphylococcus simiae]